MVETGVVTPSSVETVDNMDAAIASFDPNTGAWLSSGSPLDRGAKLVSLNEMTGINAPMITSNTGRSFGSALEWGSRGREFDSRHSDQTKIIRTCFR